MFSVLVWGFETLRKGDGGFADLERRKLYLQYNTSKHSTTFVFLFQTNQ